MHSQDHFYSLIEKILLVIEVHQEGCVIKSLSMFVFFTKLLCPYFTSCIFDESSDTLSTSVFVCRFFVC